MRSYKSLHYSSLVNSILVEGSRHILASSFSFFEKK